MTIQGKPGKLTEIQTAAILLPPFQRSPNQQRIKEGAAHFDWALFGVPFVYYQDPDFYMLDGQHRLGMAKLLGLPSIPTLAFDVDNHEHAAMIFVKLQRYRKPLVTEDLHNAELFVGGEFGAVASLAQDFVWSLETTSPPPLATIRKLVGARKTCEAMLSLQDWLGALVGPAPLHKDFLEGLAWLQADSPDPQWRRKLADFGYPIAAALLTRRLKEREQRLGKQSKEASAAVKASVLKDILVNDVPGGVPQGDLGLRVVVARAAERD